MKNFLFRLVDLIFIPIALAASQIIYILKKIGGNNLRTTYKILYRTGIFPTRDFFFIQPTIPSHFIKGYNNNSSDIKYKIEEQVDLFSSFQKLILVLKHDYPNAFRKMNNFILLAIVSKYKPKHILCGQSDIEYLKNLLPKESKLINNIYLYPDYSYELSVNASSIVEEAKESLFHVEKDFWRKFGENDIISVNVQSCVPKQEILYFLLEIMPNLNKGVLIEFKDYYPFKFVSDKFLDFNVVRYIEAFLIGNSSFEIILSIDILRSEKPQVLKGYLQYFKEEEIIKTDSLWIKKVLS